jgi:membrane protein
VHQRFRSVVPGALATVAAWIPVSLGFKAYVAHVVSYDVVYGAFGGIAALMVWLYLSALLILVGGEVNALTSWTGQDVT